MKTTRKKLVGYLMILSVIATAFIAVPIIVSAQSSDTATGTVTIGNATPTATSVEYVDSSYGIIAAYDPDNSAIWGINSTIGDANTLTDIKNITWYLFDESVHGDSGGDDWDTATPTGNSLITISWNESDDLWALSQGSFTEWTLQTPIDPGSGSGLASFEFTARFDISRAAWADTDWNATVIVYDDSVATDTAVSGSSVTMNNYFEISWSSATFTWGSVTALSTNNTMDANRTLDIWSNTQWELRINGSDFTAGGESDVDIDTEDTVMWSDTAFEDTDESLWLRNSYAIALGTWDNQVRMPTETQINRDIHFWFNDPGGQFTATVEYSIDVQIEVRANT